MWDRYSWDLTLGATQLAAELWRFRVWAPNAAEVALLVEPDQVYPMQPVGRGYYQVDVASVAPGSLYRYRIDGVKDRPDPASRAQPKGVHGPSQVVDPAFEWRDQCWAGLPLEHYIIYELHVGSFTPQGTLDAVVEQLDQLAELGITAIELMPLAQFPGERNWGYDGVFPFAVQHSYGGAQALKRLVDACHQRGMAVLLDVVYNHLGPEGNYLWDYGPYFTNDYKTPWGSAINLDGPDSDEVRRYLLENALYWINDCHIDALRLDATHAMLDFSAGTFLEELAAVVRERSHRLNRRIQLIAESDRNDPRLVQRRELGGYGLDAQWNDDFHHALHTLLTGEGKGYYMDYVDEQGDGQLKPLGTAIAEGYIYSGQYSRFRRRRHGISSYQVPPYRFVVCAQNHDQVGNRMLGERLSALVSHDALKLAAATLLLSPNLPLLFMGEEYGETAPFLYFVSHGDPALVEAVRRGRREEFAQFAWQGEVPDPQAKQTFLASKLNHRLRQQGRHRALRDFYQQLIRLRRTLPALATLDKQQLDLLCLEQERVMQIQRWAGDSHVIILLNFNPEPRSVTMPLPAGRWQKLLDSAEQRWCGEGSSTPQRLESPGSVELTLSTHSCVLFVKEG